MVDLRKHAFIAYKGILVARLYSGLDLWMWGCAVSATANEPRTETDELGTNDSYVDGERSGIV